MFVFISVSLLGLGILLARLSSTMAVWCPNQAMYIFVASALVGGTSAALMPLCQKAAHYQILALIYGFFVGPLVALDSVAIVQLIGSEKIGTGIGWTNTMDGISSIVGPPIFGALIGDGWLTYQLYAVGGLYAFSTVVYLIILRTKELNDTHFSRLDSVSESETKTHLLGSRYKSLS